jgi:hypothetical protein
MLWSICWCHCVGHVKHHRNRLKNHSVISILSQDNTTSGVGRHLEMYKKIQLGLLTVVQCRYAQLNMTMGHIYWCYELILYLALTHSHFFYLSKIKDAQITSCRQKSRDPISMQPSLFCREIIFRQSPPKTWLCQARKNVFSYKCSGGKKILLIAT